MSSAAFRRLAVEHLSSSHAAVLDQCVLGSAAPIPAGGEGGEGACGLLPEFVSKWKEWEKALVFNLAKSRAKKLKREFAAEVPDYPFDAAAAARAACEMESPLEAELFLDKARWEAIESLQGLDIFSETTIYAYMLKLLLMERGMAFNTEEGFTEYKGLYAAILGESK